MLDRTGQSDPSHAVFQTKGGGTQLLAYIETVGREIYISLDGRNHHVHRLGCTD